jgi:integrase
MFCGLRASEIERLDWKKINLTEKQIVIDSSVAKKTGSRRVVPIPEACVQWLTPYAKESGPVHPQKFLDLFDTVRIEAGFRPSNTRLHRRLEKQRKEANPKSRPFTPWPSNCLRHTAISYALAESRDESKVASWAGNSPAMIKKHYDSQAMPSGAKAFYSILPQMPHNVIGIKRKAKVA